MDLGSLKLFTSEEHHPFLWPKGKPAALLIHGFPGTPAEMRPLADILNQAGWTVQGLLLPGFGPQIDTLFERRSQEWIDAAHTALATLRDKHDPVLLIGYSLGGAIALNVATMCTPSGLILLAPFWRVGNWFHHILWYPLKRLFPWFQPFKAADFSNPRVRQAIAGLLPEVDLDSTVIQQALRDLRVPARLLDQVFEIGRSAKQAASQLTAPTLIIQGKQDEAVKPKFTRQLLQHIPAPIRYEEVNGDHQLLKIKQPAWSQIVRAILDFTQRSAPWEP